MNDSSSKIGHNFRNKLFLKWNLSKNVFNKSWCPKLVLFNEIFFFGKIRPFFDIKNWLSNYDFGTFRWTVIHWQNFFPFFPLSMLILGQKSCFLGLFWPLTWFDHFHFSYFRFHICDSCLAFAIFFMISWLMSASLSRQSLAPLTWFSRFSNFSNNVCLWPRFFYKINWLTWLRLDSWIRLKIQFVSSSFVLWHFTESI